MPLKKKFKINSAFRDDTEFQDTTNTIEPTQPSPNGLTEEDFTLEEILDRNTQIDNILLPSSDRGDLHNHDGVNSSRIDINNLNNFIETVTIIPTSKPRYFWEQFKIYIDDLDSPTTKRLYIYSNKAQIWNYVTLT